MPGIHDVARCSPTRLFTWSRTETRGRRVVTIWALESCEERWAILVVSRCLRGPDCRLRCQLSCIRDHERQNERLRRAATIFLSWVLPSGCRGMTFDVARCRRYGCAICRMRGSGACNVECEEVGLAANEASTILVGMARNPPSRVLLLAQKPTGSLASVHLSC